ncbi:MAG: bifunctional (p)ppGpp synthetase/guanosine-3',5'-bis(diphosphate) 3'-pyrophosphohydrolase [Bacteroidaceae bacterium]|nr:bifunctional (p)ppGpp synthetase/guanosine-3',5'-bis(diphosphate) 3'-pyrophosphohydrolase [Bacteroidaceae bacterium]
MNIDKEQAEERLVNEAFQGLVNSYLASKHRKKVDIITRAFNFAKHAHKGVRRNSGEPYILHPIAVARIVSEEIGLGSTSICAALLHDVVEDTEYTVEDISNLFGPKIAQIVDGLTKISGGIFGDKASAQTENFKKLLLTMSEDIRVILIKIADRLHNMRTLEHMAPNKQYKIAGETLYIYAPIAYRLGLNKIKMELENLSFKYEHPEEYMAIEEKLAMTQAEREKLFADFTAPIKAKLDEMEVKYELKGRIKSPYSIWKKMQTKHLAFDEIFDILAVRIIFEPKNLKEEANECFNIYIALSHLYRTHPDRFRDWVNQPKTNGYQALHMTLMSKHGEWVEVQIRSRRMDDIAEQGVAAHWKYKEKGYAEEEEVDLNKWLLTIKEILDDPQPDAMDFLDAIKLNLYSSEIFVFTPKGEIKTMPQGCTALDFAFSIHSVLGTHCIGAKVNHKLVPMSHVLESGDQVEVLTSKTQNVKPEWLTMVTTAKAKSKIQGILRREVRAAHKEGERLINEFVEREGLTLDVHNTARLCRLHNFTEYDQLLVALGKGSVTLGDAERNALKGSSTSTNILGRLFRSSKKEDTPSTKTSTSSEVQKIDRKRPLILTDEALQNSYHMADCCHPIPGDDVLGFIDDDGQIVIHQRKCPEAAKLKAAYGNRIVAAQWSTHKLLYFSVSLNIKGIDGVGVVNQISNVISQELNVNMERILIEAYDGIFDGTIRLRVHDVDDIKIICDNLKKINNIRSVVRIDK